MAFLTKIALDTRFDQTPTVVEVITPCWIEGKPREVGYKATLPKHEAKFLEEMKRIRIIN